MNSAHDALSFADTHTAIRDLTVECDLLIYEPAALLLGRASKCHASRSAVAPVPLTIIMKLKQLGF